MRNWLTPVRTQSIRWVALSLLLYVAVAALALWLWPASAMPATPEGRLVAAIFYLRWPVLVMLLIVVSLFRIFDTEQALDPLNDAESPRFRRNRQVLQNSVEQFALFAPTLLAMAAAVDIAPLWTLIPLSVTLFTAGRLMFWCGYHISPNARAPGFNMSFSTTLLMLALVFYLAT